jgi:hypothetical protein
MLFMPTSDPAALFMVISRWCPAASAAPAVPLFTVIPLAVRRR